MRPFTSASLIALSSAALAGCGTLGKVLPDFGAEDPEPVAAVLAPAPAPPVRLVEVPTPLPLPGQLKPLPARKAAPEPADPKARVAKATAAARVEPTGDGFVNAVQVYPYAEGALFAVYAAPGQVTDIALQPGEALVGAGAVAAGDTVRWIIGDTESGAGAGRRVHLLVKPTRAGLTTNLVVNTDRRTYHVELRSTEATYMASVSWRYPQDDLLALRGRASASAAAAPIASGIDLASLRFRYEITGDDAPWRPLRAFDDGRQVFIAFPAAIAQGEAPPLFVVGAEGGAELVNYRVRDNYYVVDRLFEAAELRLGSGKRQTRVRIVRTDAERGR